MKSLRVGLVGLGSWGEKLYRALAAMPDVRIVGGCRRGPDRPSWLPEGIPVFRDAMALLDTGKLDAVAIAVHPEDGLLIAAEAASRGIAVLMEKPYSLGMPWVFPNSSPFLVGHQHLFAPEMVNLKASIRGGVRRICCTAQGPGPERDFSSLFDYGSHALAAAHWLLGPLDASRWHGMVRTVGHRETYWGHCFIDGTPCSFVVGNDSPVKEMRVLVYDGAGTTHIYDGYKASQPLQSMLRDFVNTVKGKSAASLAYTADFRLRVSTSLLQFNLVCQDWVHR